MTDKTKPQKLPYGLTIRIRGATRGDLHKALTDLHEVVAEADDVDRRRDAWTSASGWTAHVVYTNKNAR